MDMDWDKLLAEGPVFGAVRARLLLSFLLIASNAADVRAQSAADAFEPSANDSVNSIAVQADGKILAGGLFTEIALGGSAPDVREHIVRLNSDGTIDATFDASANANVYAIALQPDGKILIGGDFSAVTPSDGAVFPRNRIARLHPDGTLDAAFDPNADGSVNSIAVQADGKILVGGLFTHFVPGGGDPVRRKHIVRLNPDGTPDPSFDPNANGPVNCIVAQADGTLLVGGDFTRIAPNEGAGVDRGFIARLNPDGTPDLGFHPNANSFVKFIAPTPDGKIVIGGFFSVLAPNGGAAVVRNHVARLNTDGTLDSAFDPNADGFLRSVAVQMDGKVLIAGDFFTLAPNGGAAVARNHLARLNTDGTLDLAFDPNADNSVSALALQTDGRILTGGPFSFIGGQRRHSLARLSNDTAASQDLAVTQTAITWTRGGSSPQLRRVSFESSTDAATYTPLGNAVAVGTSWMLTGLELPTGVDLYIRARGHYGSGIFCGSESVSEMLVRVPALPGKSDQDGDGVPDPADGCPSWPDPEQTDSDGNGRGDLCECGDQDGSGHVDVRDLLAIQLAIFDPVQATALCDTNDDGLCNVSDIVGANMTIYGRPAHCSRHPGP